MTGLRREGCRNMVGTFSEPNSQVLSYCMFRVLDSIHTALVGASIWIYLIDNFGDTSKINDIPEYVLPYHSRLFSV